MKNDKSVDGWSLLENLELLVGSMFLFAALLRIFAGDPDSTAIMRTVAYAIVACAFYLVAIYSRLNEIGRGKPKKTTLPTDEE